jgi:hypothetical protein
MKTLLLFLALLPIGLMGQTDTNLYSSDKLGFATTIPMHMITIAGEKKQLHLDFKGDSLVVTGDMTLTEGGKLFIEYCDDYLKTKIDSLEVELEKCRAKPEIDKAKTDTVAVWIDCSDTTGRNIAYNVSIKGYDIRKTNTDVCTWIYPDNKIHVGYLDSFKRPLTGYLVWETMEIINSK